MAEVRKVNVPRLGSRGMALVRLIEASQQSAMAIGTHNVLPRSALSVMLEVGEQSSYQARSLLPPKDAAWGSK